MIGKLKWTIPDVFLLFSGVIFVGGIIFLFMYYGIAKKRETHIIAKLDNEYPNRWLIAEEMK